MIKWESRLSILPVSIALFVILMGAFGIAKAEVNDANHLIPPLYPPYGYPFINFIGGTAVSPDFSNDQTVFTPLGGLIFKSANGGSDWLNVTPVSMSNFPSTLYISPNYQNDNTIFSHSGDGLYKSIDGGLTWLPTGLVTPGIISLAISPDFANDNTLLASTRVGLLRSADGGATWGAVITSPNIFPVYFVYFSPDYAADQTVFAVTSQGDVITSINNGINWSDAGFIKVNTLAFSPDYAADHTIFATTYGGIFKSVNAGQTWFSANNGVGEALSIIFSPQFSTDQALFVAGDGLFKSTNGGASWSQLTIPGEMVITLALSPNYFNDQTIFASSNNGGFRSTDGGLNWVHIGPDFEAVQKWNSGLGNWSWDASKAVAGDFNGDGRDDLAILYGYVTEREVKAFVFLADDSGDFNQPAVWWASGTGNWDLAGSIPTVGDYDGDGVDDLAVFYGYQTERDVKSFVFLSEGDGFDTPQAWWQAGPGNWDWAGSWITSGDYTGDGKDDLAAFYGYVTERDVKTFVLASGGDKFAAAEEWWHAGVGNWDWSASKVASGDFNGDNSDDLAVFYVYNWGQLAKAFVFTSGGTSFDAAQSWLVSDSDYGVYWNTTEQIFAGDYDGDGLDDLAIFNESPWSATSLLISLSTGSDLTEPSAWWWASDGWHIDAMKSLNGDFDGDGKEEQTVFYNYSNSQTGLFIFR